MIWDDLARRTHRTKAFYVRAALARRSEDTEDYYLAAELSRQKASEVMPTGDWDELQHDL